MAANKRDKRIEPTFERQSSRGGSGLSAREEDRVVRPKSRRKTKAGSSGGRRKKARRSSAGMFGRLLYWCMVLAVWGGVAAAGLVLYYGAKMPSVTTWSVPDRPPNVKIVSTDGKLVANRGMTGGAAVGLHEMSPYIPQAVIAIEDRRFYSHFGVDPMGLARAMARNVMAGRLTQGGSTLTQQLAKNMFLKPDRTIERKVQEVMLALWLESEHSKDQILEMYLNRVYFGSGAYGVEAASRRYFNKSAKDVTLAEAAVLAGLLKAPSRLSPARDPKAASERAELVLAAMREQGMIAQKELNVAMKEPATKAAAYWTGSENYVADRIMEELPDLIGEVRDDIVIHATVDLNLQRLAENSIRTLIEKNGKKLAVSQGALVSVDGTGAVRAMVGGYDYANSQFDRASEAKRQPGSAFKPFVFLAAIEKGLTPDSVRNDAPVKIGKWTPDNYKGKYFGPVTLTTALAKSLNSVAAQLVMEVGPSAVVEAAWRLGIGSSLLDNSSIALGTSEVTPLELTAAYVPFANGGYRPKLHFVSSVETVDGKVLYQFEQGKLERVITPEAVGMMNAMMTETISGGTAGKAAFGWPAAGKTGTSQKSRDAWFIGYTANLTTGVWFGNDNGSPTKNITGGSLPAIAWHDFMVAAHEGVKVRPLPGEWRSAPAVAERAPTPLEPVGEANIPANEGRASQAKPRPIKRVSPPSDMTGSIRRPQADVGDEVIGRVERKSVLDMIFGN